MWLDSSFHYLNLTLQVFFVDLLLSVDNAVVIAIACYALPPKQRRIGLLIGTVSAIVIRAVFTLGAQFLLSLPWLKLVGGVILLVIAIKLIIDTGTGTEPEPVAEPDVSPTGLWAAVSTMVIADIVMSLDHVVGLVAITNGNLIALVLGLLLSVPMLMFGSQFVLALLRRHPLLIVTGGAMLAWLAGDIAITDPAYADWVTLQAPVLPVLVPILVMVFVLVEIRLIKATQATAAVSRP